MRQKQLFQHVVKICLNFMDPWRERWERKREKSFTRVLLSLINEFPHWCVYTLREIILRVVHPSLMITYHDVITVIHLIRPTILLKDHGHMKGFVVFLSLSSSQYTLLLLLIGVYITIFLLFLLSSFLIFQTHFSFLQPF